MSLTTEDKVIILSPHCQSVFCVLGWSLLKSLSFSFFLFFCIVFCEFVCKWVLNLLSLDLVRTKASGAESSASWHQPASPRPERVRVNTNRIQELKSSPLHLQLNVKHHADVTLFRNAECSSTVDAGPRRSLVLLSHNPELWVLFASNGNKLSLNDDLVHLDSWNCLYCGPRGPGLVMSEHKSSNCA